MRLIALATLASASALSLPPLLPRRLSGSLEPPPPAGFQWSSVDARLTGMIVPVKIPVAVPTALKQCAPSLSQRVAQHAPDACGVFTAIGRGVGIATKEYANIAAAATAAYWALAAARIKAHGPDAIAVFTAIGRGVGAASSEYSKVAALAAATYWALTAARIKAHGPDAIAVFTAIGRGVGAASSDYAQLIAANAAAYLEQAAGVAVQLRRLRKVAALKREGQAAVERREAVAAALALSSKLSFHLIAKRSEATAARGTLRAKLVVLASALAAFRSTVSQRIQQNAPDAIAVFTAIGRGVGAASSDYAQLIAANAAAYLEQAAGVAVQLRRLRKVAALKREGQAAVERREAVAAALAKARLGLASVAVVARREAVSAALSDALVKVRPEGAKSIEAPVAATAEPTAGSAPAARTAGPLLAECAAIVARRAEVTDAFEAKWKIVILKREGEAAVAKREEMAAALKQAMPVKLQPPAAPNPSAAMLPPDGFVWGEEF
jgi:hypothetical protein